MVHLQRKLKCMYVGEDKYKPEGIPENKWLQVIGYETKRRNTRKPNSNEMIVVEDTYLKVINNNGMIVDLAAFNCKVTIDNEENAIVSLAAAVGHLVSIIEGSCCEGMINIKTN